LIDFPYFNLLVSIFIQFYGNSSPIYIIIILIYRVDTVSVWVSSRKFTKVGIQILWNTIASCHSYCSDWRNTWLWGTFPKINRFESKVQVLGEEKHSWYESQECRLCLLKNTSTKHYRYMYICMLLIQKNRAFWRY